MNTITVKVRRHEGVRNSVRPVKIRFFQCFGSVYKNGIHYIVMGYRWLQKKDKRLLVNLENRTLKLDPQYSEQRTTRKFPSSVHLGLLVNSFLLKYFLKFIFRERTREGEREGGRQGFKRETSIGCLSYSVASRMCPNGD